MRKNYFVRDRPVELEEVMVISSVHEEVPSIRGHLIIITKTVNNLYDLILPLRARFVDRLQYIVILCPNDITRADWRNIALFEAILVVNGSGLKESDIRRAGIFHASDVVVLADASANNQTSNAENSKKHGGNEALVDADAIFSYQCAKRLNEHIHVVVEIVQQTNVGYLDPESADVNYKFTPPFASGVLFTSGMLDTLICQAFYNPRIIQILDQLINGQGLGGGKDGTVTSPLPGAGDTHNSLTVSRKPPPRGSSLYQIKVPDDLESKTYGALFKYLAQRNMIPLGLFRGVFPQMRQGPKGNKMPYVFTNPPRDTELFSCDRVFVLSQQPQVASQQGGRHSSEPFKVRHFFTCLR